MFASISGGGAGLGRAWANMTPPGAEGGCPAATPAGEPTTISQLLTNPATTNRPMCCAIVPSPFPLCIPGIIGMHRGAGAKGKRQPGAAPWVATSSM